MSKKEKKTKIYEVIDATMGKPYKTYVEASEPRVRKMIEYEKQLYNRDIKAGETPPNIIYFEVSEEDITSEIREEARLKGKEIYSSQKNRADLNRADKNFSTPGKHDKYDLRQEHFTKVLINRQKRRAQKLRARNLEGTLATITFVTGLLFLSPNITGNAIADINTSNSNIIGAILFIIGLIGGFFWIKSSKNN